MDAAVDFRPQHGDFVLRGRGDAVALLAHVFWPHISDSNSREFALDFLPYKFPSKYKISFKL